MTAEPDWLTAADIQYIQDAMIEIKGHRGLTDWGRLEMAVHRPINRWAYALPSLSPSIFELASEYAFAIGTLHPFSDANKRTGFASAMAFLAFNGTAIATDVVDGYSGSPAENQMVGLVMGEISVEDFASWLAINAIAYSGYDANQSSPEGR